jgi:hypothetical protein
MYGMGIEWCSALHEAFIEARNSIQPRKKRCRSRTKLKAYGLPLPQDLVQFEHDLEAEFAAVKQDNERRARMDKVIRQRARR